MLQKTGFARCIRLTIGLSLCFVSTAWPTARGAEPMEVFVSIVPQKTFVEKLSGDLVKVSVMVQPGPADLRELIRHAREKGIKVVFVQLEFSTKSAETIAKAIEGQVLFADPLAPDWGRNLEEVAAKFKAALG